MVADEKVIPPSTEDKEDPNEVFALQFPEIEHLLGSGNLDKVNKSFTSSYEALEKLARGGKGMGKTRDARKAMKAIEKTMDLFRDLFRLKQQMKMSGGESLEPGVLKPQKKK